MELQTTVHPQIYSEMVNPAHMTHSLFDVLADIAAPMKLFLKTIGYDKDPVSKPIEIPEKLFIFPDSCRNYYTKYVDLNSTPKFHEILSK